MYKCVHLGTSMTHVHVDNNITMINNQNSSAAEIGSELKSMKRATAAQDNANNTEKLGKIWLIRYDELVAYKEQNGHCNVPQKYAQNKPLGLWVSNQRYQYLLLCKGKPSYMTAERQVALENIGFEWSLNQESLWQTRHEELIAFKQQNGHCNVPQQYDQNKSLGRWVRSQRNQYKLKCKGKPSSMTAERQAALEEIGFEWRLLNNSSWHTRYKELIAYKHQNGHCNVPARYEPNKDLAKWVSTQRYQYRLKFFDRPSFMTAERIAALKMIGFEWG